MSPASDRSVLSSASVDPDAPRSAARPAFLERWRLPMPAELVGPEAAGDPGVRDDAVVDAHADPDHHLWRNGRLWWAAISVLEHGWRQERVRVSLQTSDVELARRRRDALIACVNAVEGCELSLRFDGRRQQKRRVARRGEMRGTRGRGRPERAGVPRSGAGSN